MLLDDKKTIYQFVTSDKLLEWTSNTGPRYSYSPSRYQGRPGTVQQRYRSPDTAE